MALNGTVDAELRRQALVDALAERGRLTLTEGVEICDVHPMTIRRDFELLENAGLARRVRGAIIAVTPNDFEQRESSNLSAKRRISQKALTLLPESGALGMDASTTVYQIALALPEHRAFSVITNGLTSFEALHRKGGVRGFLTGGEREEHNISLVGQLAAQSLENFNLALCFISAESVNPASGTSESTMEQVGVKEAMAKAAERVVLCVDSSKLNTGSPVRSLQLDRIHTLITELDPADPRLDDYREHVRHIL